MQTDDYKHTLNLPETSFPMKADLPKKEPQWLKLWQDLNVYQKMREQRKNAQPFLLLDGPPYANGNIHLGHAGNKILKDIIVKSRMLMGWNAPYVPGWDCHGLPIEVNIEKKLGRGAAKKDPAAFRKACREYAESQIAIQKAAFIRLGVLGDWDNPYTTMDFRFEAEIVRSLGRCLQKGYVVPGYKPVHWCLECASSLALAEVEYKEKTSSSVVVKFLVEQSASGWPATDGKPVYALIWTTTPWTLPGNEAIAFHPDEPYVLVAATDAKVYYLLHEKRAAVLFPDASVVARFMGADLAKKQAHHPFLAGKQVPFLSATHVTAEDGTGLVHTAPAYGPEDFALGQQHKLPITQPILDNGRFDDSIEWLSGKGVWEANELVIGCLQETGALLSATTIQHSYAHCWRHKTPLIFRATKQWFIDFQSQAFVNALLASLDAVQWVPDWSKERMRAMLTSHPDWCISRQRTWGTPLALVVHTETGALHPNMAELIEIIANKIEAEGLEAWYGLDLQELIGAEANQYHKMNDTLDVWFDSGVVHTAISRLHGEIDFPADVYIEGSDQHRGWFQSSLITAMMLKEAPPYKTVLTHGFTVDQNGHKMSKSLGNIVEPKTVIDQWGADILRLWAASTDYRGEMSFSSEILTRTSEAYRRIRNTMRFLLANLKDFTLADALPCDEWVHLDKYIVKAAHTLMEEVKEAYCTYQFHPIYHKIHNFCVVELGGFYLDVIKDRQYTLPKHHKGRRSAQTAIYHLLSMLVRMLAPILSFTAEEVWQHLPNPSAPSVFLSDWQINLAIPNVEYDWAKLMVVRAGVNQALEAARKMQVIGSGLEADVTLYADPAMLSYLATLGTELRFALITSSVVLAPIAEAPKDAIECGDLKITITKSTHEKCVRCWHRVDSIGKNSIHPSLCLRCVENIEGSGEVRMWA